MCRMSSGRPKKHAERSRVAEKAAELPEVDRLKSAKPEPQTGVFDKGSESSARRLQPGDEHHRAAEELRFRYVPARARPPTPRSAD